METVVFESAVRPFTGGLPSRSVADPGTLPPVILSNVFSKIQSDCVLNGMIQTCVGGLRPKLET
jgi:hypothetical protein